MTHRIYITILLTLAIVPSVSSAPRYIAPSEEAPPAILDTRLGDTTVSLFVAGSWELALAGAIGWSMISGFPPLVRPFPGMTPGVAFRQFPDLSIFLLIDDRYSFETSVVDGYELNRFVFGYDGAPGEPLRRVRIGNADIVIDNYPYLAFGATPDSSIGASARFELGDSSHEAAFRAQPSGFVSRTFLGTNETTSIRLHPADYLRSRFFVLPDEDIDDVELLVECSSDAADARPGSDGRWYRPVSGGVAVSTATGTVSFDRRLDRRALIRYVKAGLPVGSPGLGVAALPAVGESGLFDPDSAPIDFAFTGFSWLGFALDSYRVTVGGTDYLLLSSPDRFSPFEHAGYYALSGPRPDESWRTRVTIEGAAGSAVPSSAISADIRPANASATMRLLDGSYAPRSPLSRYPLLRITALPYGPNAPSSREVITERIRLETLTPADRIILDRPVPGSIRLTVNGVPDFRFSVSPDGRLDPGFIPLETDRMNVTYRSTDSAAAGTDLAFGFGSRLPFGDDSEATLGISAYWNIATDAYSTERNDHPGNLIAAGSVSHRTDQWSLVARAAATITSSDTSGAFRILGDVSRSLSVPINAGSIFPASPPEAAIEGSSFPAESRGRLIYKDYTRSGIGGTSYLASHEITVDSDRVAPYEAGGVTGPYPASATVGGSTSTAVVLDYELSSTDSWVGAVVRLPFGAVGTYASSFDGMHLSWLADTGLDLGIHVQIGQIGEDLDADGVLDAESGVLATGFVFDDLSAGLALRAGTGIDGGNGYLDTEDSNGNGILDRESTASLVTRSFSPGSVDYPDSSWKTIRIRFDEAERRALRDATAVRILIVRPDAVPADSAFGRLVVTGIGFTGAYLAPVPGNENALAISGDSTDELLDSLVASHPAIERFHRDGNAEVIRIDFDETNAGEPLTAKTRINQVTPEDYETLRVYLRGDDAIVTFVLFDDNGLGIRFPVRVPDDDRWHEASFQLRESTVEIDGTPTSGSSAAYDRTAGPLSVLSIAVEATQPGSIYIDELHFASGVVRAGAGGDITVGFRAPGAIVGNDRFPILSGLSVDQSLRAGTDEFAPAIGSRGGGFFESTTQARIDVGPIGTRSFVDATTSPDGVSYTAGYSLKAPNIPFPVTVTDSYSLTGGSTVRAFARSNSITLAVPGFSTRLAVRVTAGVDTLTRDYDLSLSASPVAWLELISRVDASEYNTSYTPAEQSELPSIASSYLLYAPSVDSGFERSISATAGVRAGGPQLSISFTPSFTVVAPATLPGHLDTAARIAIALPFTSPGTPRFSGRIELARSVDLRIPAPPSEDHSPSQAAIVSDMAAALGSLRDQHYLFAIPGTGFDRDLATRFVSSIAGYEAAAYETRGGFNLSRAPGSFLVNLFVPARWSADVVRRLELEYPQPFDRIEVTSDLVWSAVNLFGALGSYPVLRWFDTDEYRFALETDFSPADSAGAASLRLDLTGSGRFFCGDDELSIDQSITGIHGLRWTLVESLTAMLSRRRSLKNGISIPFLNIAVTDDVYFTHVETVSIEAGGDDRLFGIRATHETGIAVADLGTLSGSISFGFETRNIDADEPLRSIATGLEVGIRARFTL